MYKTIKSSLQKATSLLAKSLEDTPVIQKDGTFQLEQERPTRVFIENILEFV